MGAALTTTSAEVITRSFDDLDLADLRQRPGAKWRCVPADVLPAWVADMDFPVADPILDRVRRIAGGADLGYPDWPGGVSPLREVFAARMASRYGWHPRADHVREFANVTQAVQVMLHLVTAVGDVVAIHTPAFRPITAGVTAMGRRVLPVPMRDDGSRWQFDAERFAREVAGTGCRVLLLVNPHNPTGRVFTADELHAMAEIAVRHDLLVISDEVHSDLTYQPYAHIPFASLGPEVAARTITVTSASKAFNLAGLRTAVCHVGVAAARQALADQPAELFGAVNVLGVQATIAAWTECDAWQTATLRYLEQNRLLVCDVLRREAPRIRLLAPEATYLAWLDCRALGWDEDPASRFLREGRVLLSAGPDFDPGGDGFVRLNFASPRHVLTDVLRRIVGTVNRP
ncbi:MalY/PatB family protein [Micromonospora coxensis]|uniref:MalY/PatB family protein n=1 Tax=Micromonospora coxensis TaxID=356852 RepID=UPI00341F7074